MADEDLDLEEDYWLGQRLCETEKLIVAYEAAILALSTGAQSYTLDTGQTRQTVQKSSVGELRIALNELENRRAVIRSQLRGKPIHVAPSF